MWNKVESKSMEVVNKVAVLGEVITNGMYYDVLNLIGLTSVLFGILVIVSKNPIVSVLFLIGLFIVIAGYLTMLGLNFIGLSYLLVYVGAVSILFLFILMLINVRISELATGNNNSIPLAVIVISFVSITQFYAELEKTFGLLFKYISQYTVLGSTVSGNNEITSSNNNVLAAFYSNWDIKLSETSHITTIGNVLYTNYPMWLILTSLILLLSMVGSILITIKQ